MPNITLIRSHLFEAIGRSYSDKEFDELCFEFGVEVDDVMTETIEVDNNCFLDFLFLQIVIFNSSNSYLLSSPQMAVRKSM
jgi:phenylalanyl-tRNA synthetase beta chain